MSSIQQLLVFDRSAFSSTLDLFFQLPLYIIYTFLIFLPFATLNRKIHLAAPTQAHDIFQKIITSLVMLQLFLTFYLFLLNYSTFIYSNLIYFDYFRILMSSFYSIHLVDHPLTVRKIISPSYNCLPSLNYYPIFIYF